MLTTQYITNLLEQYQNTFNIALTETSPRVNSSCPTLQTSLYPHQCAILHRMEELEVNLRAGLEVSTDPPTKLFSRYAILGDGVGTGKTVTVLAHIARMKQTAFPLPTHLHPHSSSTFFSLQEETERPYTLLNSLIVVPHTLFQQWESELQTKTSLKYTAIRTSSYLQRETFFEDIRSSDCVLLSNTLFSKFQQSIRAACNDTELRWRRIFFDEANTIRIPPSALSPSSDIVWFITSKYADLLFANKFLHSLSIRNMSQSDIQAYHPNLQAILRHHIESQLNRITYFRCQSFHYFKSYLEEQHPLKYYLVIQCNSDFISSSIQRPEHIIHRIDYRDISASTTEPVFTSDILSLLDSSAPLSHVLETLHIQSYTQEEFNTLHASDPPDIQRRIEDQSECPICYNSFHIPTYVPCCSHRYCLRCIGHSLSISSFCPICRQSIQTSQLQILSSESPPPRPIESIPTKQQRVIEILQQNPQGKFIFFSRYAHMLYPYLTSSLEQYGIHMRSAFLKGNKHAIASALKQFDSGHLQILLLPLQSNMAGLHILSATHCIFLHRMTAAEKELCVGRSYRLGRRTPFISYELLPAPRGFSTNP